MVKKKTKKESLKGNSYSDYLVDVIISIIKSFNMTQHFPVTFCPARMERATGEESQAAELLSWSEPPALRRDSGVRNPT